jgi:GTP diphosphokinase / guanosine-3',5'-bis(diphosphate) 3'-diphosphatase
VRGEVTGRPKHYYSIYQKMVLRGKEFDEIHDLVAVRVIVESVRDCYAVLGQVHSVWRPVPGRFKDYIAMPKLNRYQSLHTTVVGPEAASSRSRSERQRCTAPPSSVSPRIGSTRIRRRGRATQRSCHGSPSSSSGRTRSVNPGDYLESLRIDLYQDEVFVFTPKGEVLGLPARSTPIDFAYAVHTEVGHRCIGARVNGRLVSLDHELDNGDTIEILTSRAEDAGPSRDWLADGRLVASALEDPRAFQP